MRARAVFVGWATMSLVVLLCQACGRSIVPAAGEPTPRLRSASDGRVHVLHSYLLTRLNVLAARSHTFRAALDSLRSGAIEVLIGTPELLADAAPLLGYQMAPPRVGEFAAIIDTVSGRLETLIVRVDLVRLANLPRSRAYNVLAWFSQRRRRAELDRLVDSVLIHEVWGHLVPVALAGTMTARCADPLPGESEVDSCVMRRENELRRDMGLPERQHYAIDAR